MLQIEALEILKTGSNVFLTGAPGAGKTYVINEYIKYLRLHNVFPSVTASTGIAATHIGGSTIHSWSGIGINRYLNDYTLSNILDKEYVVKKVKGSKVLIIDEISMLSADTLDNVNTICKEILMSDKPFGGLQVVFVGDFFQLPPIEKRADNAAEDTVKNYAFKSAAWKEAKPLTCYIKEQYRQSDTELSDILLSIRNKTFTEKHFDILDEVIKKTKKQNKKEKTNEDEEGNLENITKLFTHNKDVDQINEQELAKIEEPDFVYKMKAFGKKNLTDTLIKSCLSPEELRLKVGATVMCVKNNPDEGYVNGTIGTIVSLSSGTIKMRSKQGRLIEIEPSDWAVEENGEVKARITQYPLRLAWAITVHKSQGMSLDAAYMDLSKTFEYGQGYVALSRVKTLEGLFLEDYNEMVMMVEDQVFNFDKTLQENSDKIKMRFAESDKGKLEQTQKEFLKKIGGDPKANPDRLKINVEDFKKPAKKDTYTETLELVAKGVKFEKIAKSRLLSPNTILDHIEKLFEDKRISPDDVKNIFPEKMQKIPKKIKDAFTKLGAAKLAPVYKVIEESHSYEELRIYRMFYE